MNYENKSTFVGQLRVKHINWMSQMPFAFQRNGKPKIHYQHARQWWGESDDGIAVTTGFAKNNGIKIMLKPQIWMGGEYTGKMRLKSQEDWKTWENDYRDFILSYAHLADSLEHETFCVGNELHPSVKNRPAFWKELIDTIRSFYPGKLTYAANWDEYREVPFWDQLDWIGVNAYFPLSQKKTPTIKDLVGAWQEIIPRLKKFSDSIKVPVVFTEIGYKSVDSCAWEPWNPRSKTANQDAQLNAYKALFCAFSRHTSWFKGYFLWKWYPDVNKTDSRWDTDYTPQNKMAEKEIGRN